jgi:hypothetical protein
LISLFQTLMHHQNQEKTAMSFRKQCAGIATAAVAASVLAFAGPAHAATTTHDLDDPSFDPGTPAVAADLVGVGSDTSQHALHLVGESWNAAGHAFRVASFAATSAGSIGIPNGDILRPNGSGAGKKKLYDNGSTAVNDADVDFARSSSDQNTEEDGAGLKSIPFALDTMQLVVSGNVASHAPATITPAQMVAIYQCNTTDWATIGGTTGTIAPKIPQAGSGTRSFFEAQLKSANAGVAVTLGACVLPVQEHDDTEIKGNADAVAPFSVGRAALLGTTVKLEAGFKADRALYNVVRGTSGANGVGADDASIQAVFGENGFLCSNDARDEIEAAGFKQLASTADGGACGTLVSSTSNFALNEQVISSTAVSAQFLTAGSAKLTASITPSTAAGSVEFFDGATSVGQALVSSGTATFTATGLTVGEHQFTAKFTPDSSTVAASQAVTSGYVKSGSSVPLAFSSAPSYGKAVTIQTTTTGVPEGATITFNVGSYTKTATVASHIAKITYSTLNPGTYAVKATYAGSSQVAGSTASKSLVVAKAAPVISESFPTATLVGKPGTGTVKVAISGSTLKPTGTVRIYRGTTLLKSVTLSSTTGSASITLPKLPMGTQKLLIKYYGSAKVNAGSKYFYITQK